MYFSRITIKPDAVKSSDFLRVATGPYQIHSMIWELFSESDIVTLHIPETESTRKFLGASLLSCMKTGAMIVNCARAGIIDEDALRAAKSVKKLRYVTDVYPKDEPGEKSIADVADVMMPHLGANTKEANFTAAKRAGEELAAYFEQGERIYVVNK